MNKNKKQFIIPTISVINFTEDDLIITTSRDPYIDPIWEETSALADINEE